LTFHRARANNRPMGNAEFRRDPPTGYAGNAEFRRDPPTGYA